MWRLLGVLAVFAVGFASEARADLFSQWDRNGDGFVDADEYGANVAATRYFEDWDSDGDGSVSEEEFVTGLWYRINVSGGPVLSTDQWDAGFDQYFGEDPIELTLSVWDPDGNKEITRAEFDNASREAGLFTKLFGGDAAGTRVDHQRFYASFFAFSDANGDGRLSRDEFLIGRYVTAP